MGVIPIWLVIALNVILFLGITARMISAQALMTALPEPKDRGAFMGINSSIQQISGGIASAVASMIVIQSDSGKILHYDILGHVVSITVLITIALMYFINQMIFTGAITSEKAIKKVV